VCDAVLLPVLGKGAIGLLVLLLTCCLLWPNLGLQVYLSKRIPPEAGLGGGSANAATAARGDTPSTETIAPVQVTRGSEVAVARFELDHSQEDPSLTSAGVRNAPCLCLARGYL